MKRTINQRNEALIDQGLGDRLTRDEKLTYLLLKRYYAGTKAGHLNVDSGDLRLTMKELGISDTRALALKMSELTYKVSDGK